MWVDWEEGMRTKPTNLDTVDLAETLDEIGELLARTRIHFCGFAPLVAFSPGTPRLRAGGDLQEGKGRNEASSETSSPPLGSAIEPIRSAGGGAGRSWYGAGGSEGCRLTGRQDQGGTDLRHCWQIA